LLHALPLCGAALTFFAAAKKVSKESGLTPPILDLYPRAPNVPIIRAATLYLAAVASAFTKRLTRSTHPYVSQLRQTITAPLRQTVCWFSRLEAQCSCQKTFCAPTFVVRKPTHSLPQMGAGEATTRAAEEVFEAGEAYNRALATNMRQNVTE
jgi:hypothetical protein